jgi:purine-nucleoside phosphorylase
MTEVYSLEIQKHFQRCSKELHIRLFEGVYAGLLGPQYETPAEIRMLARLGADAVGMSTVLEAVQARALGMQVAGFSCLTNWAAGISTTPLDHAEVLATGKIAANQFCTLLKRALTTYSQGAT